MLIFICFSAGTATAANIQTVFITRFFGGVFASAPVTIVGGALADMWNQRQRGSAIVVYSLCIVGGPTVAPVIGAAVSQSYLTWRWCVRSCFHYVFSALCHYVCFVFCHHASFHRPSGISLVGHSS
jgi:DHA1 family multidrug resistance protein-like MFS transporter